MIKSTKDTNGEYVEFEEVQTPACGNGFDGLCAPPYHIHVAQKEVFTVLEGDFMYMLEGEVRVFFPFYWIRFGNSSDI